MKILRTQIDKRGNGFIEVIPEDAEDLWHLYNIVHIGDNIRCKTDRKHQKETSGGQISVERIKTVITIRVKKIDYDSEGGILRISGQNVCINKFVKIGQYHTVNLVSTKKVSISKKFWDKIDLDRITDASDQSKKCDVGAIVMEEGLAYICLISQHMTLVKQKIEKSVSKKRFVKSHQKGMEKFYNSLMVGIMNHFDFNIVKVVVIASPGFYKDQFFDFLKRMSHKQENKIIAKNLQKFLLVHSNSGEKQALKEVLSNKKVIQRLDNTKAMKEIKILNIFFKMLNDDKDKVIFGKRPVKRAEEQKAIESLLITDKLFRSSKIQERKDYVKLVEDVKTTGGNVYIFSSLHVSGEQLDQISGIAAILRFPVHSAFQDSDSDYDSDEED